MALQTVYNNMSNGNIQTQIHDMNSVAVANSWEDCLVIGTVSGEVHIWDGSKKQFATGDEPYQIHKSYIFWIEIRGDTCVSISADRTQALFTIKREDGVPTIKVISSQSTETVAWGCDISFEHNIYVTAGNAGKVTTWDLKTGEKLETVDINQTILDVTFVGNYCACAGGGKGAIQILSLPSLEEIQTLYVSPETVFSICNEGHFLFTCDYKTVTMWDVRTMNEVFKHSYTYSFDRLQPISEMCVYNNKLIVGVLGYGADKKSVSLHIYDIADIIATQNVEYKVIDVHGASHDIVKIKSISMVPNRDVLYVAHQHGFIQVQFCKQQKVVLSFFRKLFGVGSRK